jgi:hypothetical protein
MKKMGDEGLELRPDSTANTTSVPRSGAESGAVAADPDAIDGAASRLQSPLDADLAAVINAWPALPEAVKAGILAMIPKPVPANGVLKVEAAGRPTGLRL